MVVAHNLFGPRRPRSLALLRRDPDAENARPDAQIPDRLLSSGASPRAVAVVQASIRRRRQAAELASLSAELAALETAPAVEAPSS